MANFADPNIEIGVFELDDSIQIDIQIQLGWLFHPVTPVWTPLRKQSETLTAQRVTWIVR